MLQKALPKHCIEADVGAARGHDTGSQALLQPHASPRPKLPATGTQLGRHSAKTGGSVWVGHVDALMAGQLGGAVGAEMAGQGCQAARGAATR